VNGFQKALLVIGAACIIAALLWPVLSKVGIGRLPGDILIKRENFTFYFPLTTMILVSIVITVILRFLQK
jgi:hypothetical protein